MDRKEWIDIMKGIGIICVVAGHAYSGITKQIIFLFHMPLFFFLGGYLFKTRVNTLQYFKDKLIHLIVPYISFLIILYFPFFIPFSNNPEASNWLKYFIIPIIGGQLLSNIVGVFWFITCFFLTQQLFNFLILKLSILKLKILITLFLAISYINSILFPFFWLPWSINVIFAALPIFYIGYYLKTKDFKINTILILFLSIIVIMSTLYLTSNTYDMKYGNYGIPIITLISSITLILLIKTIAIRFQKIKFLSIPLASTGKASMTIMYLHIPIKYLLTFVFVFSLLISFLFHFIFLKSTFTRGLLLGSKKDFIQLFFIKNAS